MPKLEIIMKPETYDTCHKSTSVFGWLDVDEFPLGPAFDREGDGAKQWSQIPLI